ARLRELEHRHARTFECLGAADHLHGVVTHGRDLEVRGQLKNEPLDCFLEVERLAPAWLPNPVADETELLAVLRDRDNSGTVVLRCGVYADRERSERETLIRDRQQRRVNAGVPLLPGDERLLPRPPLIQMQTSVGAGPERLGLLGVVVLD